MVQKEAMHTAEVVAPAHSTWWYAINATDARRFWKPTITTDFASAHTSSVDGTMNRATCLRSCCDPRHRLSVDQSEVSPRNFPPHA